MLESRHNCSSEPLGFAVHLWGICQFGEVLYSEVAAYGSEDLACKLLTVVRKQVSWDPERDCPMIKEQIRYILRTRP